MTEKKVFINDDNKADIICPDCRSVKTLDISLYKESSTASIMKFECSCGHTSMILVERRKFYRKGTNISGIYISGVEEEQPMTVKDLSLIGLKFKTESDIKITVGDKLFVKFPLDDEETVFVRKEAVVKSVSDEFIGAEFCTTDPESPSDEAIRFYVIP